MHLILKIILSAWLGASLLVAAEAYYPSSLIKGGGRNDFPIVRRAELDALNHFWGHLDTRSRDGFEWKFIRRLADTTHTYSTYGLYYRGRQVVDHRLNLSYNREGWMEDVFGAKADFDVEDADFDREEWVETDIRRLRVAYHRLQEHEMEYGKFDGRMEVMPVYWVDPASKKALPAFEVRFVSKLPYIVAHTIVDSLSDEVLEKKKTMWLIDNNTYDIHPDKSSALLKIFPRLTSGTMISDSFFRVRREQATAWNGSPFTQITDTNTISMVDVDSDSPDYTPDNALANYNHECPAGLVTDCAQEKFDAVNVYYHLDNYRNRLGTYFSELGLSPAFSADPLNVIVNSLSVDVNEDKKFGNDVNNAAFILLTFSDGSKEKRLIFLRPATASSTDCGSSLDFFHLAREATVIVHEYQHYVTDNITGMVSGGTKSNVGDALHEGYSDYIGVSQVSRLSGQTVTKVGEYGFKNCPKIIRDVAVLTPFNDASSDFKDPHTAGLSFASGLWQLRTEFLTEFGSTTGVANADKLAIKSLFFLSAKPGFIEAVEALVKADEALHSGSHVIRIRKLFYTELKFLGAISPFRDTENRIAEMGFQSCSAVHGAGRISSFRSFLIFALWLYGIRWLGRRAWV